MTEHTTECRHCFRPFAFDAEEFRPMFCEPCAEQRRVKQSPKDEPPIIVCRICKKEMESEQPFCGERCRKEARRRAFREK